MQLTFDVDVEAFQPEFVAGAERVAEVNVILYGTPSRSAMTSGRPAWHTRPGIRTGRRGFFPAGDGDDAVVPLLLDRH